LEGGVSDEVDRLWRLRELDEKASLLRARLAKAPAEKQALEGRVDAEKRRAAAHQKATGDLQIARRKVEQEIEGVNAQQRQFESRQPVVKTNEEYRALTQEIAGCKAKRSDLETQVLMRLEDEEKLATEKTLIDKALKEAEADLAARRGVIERDESEAKEQLAQIDAQRGELMSGLPATTRQRYERIHSSREGRAVVPILKQACGGCYRQQPPQNIQEARRGDRVPICDGCGRMLVWPPDAA